jgi:hypothetical protein
MDGWGWREWFIVVGTAVILLCVAFALFLLAVGSVRP